MPISVTNQAMVFLWSVAAGMAVAFVYDIFRITRKTIRTSNLITQLEDLIYWILAALLMFGVVYAINEGEIRGYVFLGIAIGAVLYGLLLSKPIMTVSLFIADILNRIIKFLVMILTFPGRLAVRLLRPPLGALRRWFRRGLGFLAKMVRRKLANGIHGITRFNRIRKKI